MSLLDWLDLKTICDVCEECQKRPLMSSEEVWMLSHLDQEEIERECEKRMTVSRGGCESRCNSDLLDPMDCHNENDNCHCVGQDTGKTWIFYSQ